MTAGFARHVLVRRTVVALVLGLSGVSLAYAHGTHHTCFSGLEVSAGTDAGGDLFRDVTFIGIDNRANEDGGANPAACDNWTTHGNGGAWSAKIDRLGPAGFGKVVTVVGGKWLWVDDDGRVHGGRVQGGYVHWTPAINEDTFNCGNGVAKFSVTLSMTWPPHTGTFEGCLDDMHRDPAQQPYVPVPRIWGELKLN